LQALAISVSAALFAAGCGALAVLAPAQTASQPTTAKSTAAARKSTKSMPVAKSTVASKSTTAKSTAAKFPPVKSTAAKSTTRSTINKAAAKSATKPVASSYRAPQQQPTPDRYQEIQQALADRGYFGGPVDGNWGPTSVDALKRFQHDQSLLEDGKVGALSLIALGLGPKRQTAPDPATAPNARKGAEAPEAP
jgi:peptidoglycan hydrolase-like protein with peptidoglycan-binding domain